MASGVDTRACTQTQTHTNLYTYRDESDIKKSGVRQPVASVHLLLIGSRNQLHISMKSKEAS